MDVLLAALPRTLGSLFDDRSESLGIGYLAAVLRREGHEVEILDGCIGDMTADDLAREILRRDFRMLGLGRFDDGSLETAAAVLERIRSEGVRAHVCAGGHLASLDPGRVLSAFPGLDSIVRGEGEETVVDLADRVSRGGEWRDTPGIAFRDGDSVVNTPMRPLIRDLDSLPFPARDMLPRSKAAIGQASVYSSRGCMGRCAFCSIHAFYRLAGGPRWRGRSPGNVVNEIRSLVVSHGVDYIVFNDDNFLDDRARAKRIASLLVEEALPVRFSIQSRADCVDRELLSDLKNAGLHTLGLGIESGRQGGLDLLGKGVTVDQNRRAIEMAYGLGLSCRIGFIMFGPSTTIAELREDFRFLSDIGQVSPLLFLRKLGIDGGTPLEERMRREGRLPSSGAWGGWRFADPRVEAACEMLTESCRWLVPLFVRLWDIEGRMGLSGAQLGAIDPTLLDLVKRKVNDATLGFALEILDYAEAHGGDPPERRDETTSRMRSRVQEYDREIRALLALGEGAA